MSTVCWPAIKFMSLLKTSLPFTSFKIKVAVMSVSEVFTNATPVMLLSLFSIGAAKPLIIPLINLMPLVPT